MDHMRIAEQIMKTVDSMIDPHASLEQQLSQMRAQLEALSHLPMVIQQKVDAVNRQINHIREMSFKEVRQEKYLEIEKPGEERIVQFERHPEDSRHSVEITELEPDNELEGESEKNVEIRVTKPSLTEEELQLQQEEVKKMLECKMKKDTHKEETIHQIQLENQPQSIPRVKPTPAFGPAPQERPLVLPGGRKWKKSMEYDEELIQETLTAQAEVIKGKAIGVNFMKYQKPPPALDHLQRSEVFKAIHNMDEAPTKKVEMLRPAFAEADYRERMRPMSPCPNGR